MDRKCEDSLSTLVENMSFDGEKKMGRSKEELSWDTPIWIWDWDLEIPSLDGVPTWDKIAKTTSTSLDGEDDEDGSRSRLKRRKESRSLCDSDSDGEEETTLVKLVEHDYENFSFVALNHLAWRLYRRERRCSLRNSVYLDLRVHRFKSEFETSMQMWLEICVDPTTGSVCGNRIDLVKTDEIRKHLSDLNFYGCAVSGSNIIILGGSRKEKSFFSLWSCPKSSSDKVFMYNTNEKNWISLPNMNAKRGCSPVVVALEDRFIFVFGGNPQIPKLESCKLFNTTCCDDEPPLVFCENLGKSGQADMERIHQENNESTLQEKIRTQRWSEFYDMETGVWSYLPEYPPSCLAAAGHLTACYAVCPNQHLILFWVHDVYAVSFNYKSWKWEKYQYGPAIHRNPTYNSKLVVIEDFLFWNDSTTIYAHDLCKHITLPVCVLPIFDCFDPQLYNAYSRSYLVRIGKGKLCLVGQAETSKISYITFLVHLSYGEQGLTLSLHVDRKGFLNTSTIGVKTGIATIGHALEISS